MSIASLRRLGTLIRDHRDLLLARWRRQVRQLPSAQALDTPSLNDHMPFLLDELADALEAQPDNEIEEALLQGSPPAHGRQRLHDGFNVEEVVAEYNVLRGCIHDLAEENGMVIHGPDLRVVNRIIDEAIGLAVQTYATQLSLEIKKHRDEHIAFVANDLRTPLQAISLTVSLFERNMDGAVTDGPASKLLTVLRRNIAQLEKSVTDVIKTTGDPVIDATTKLERRDLNLWPLVESVIDGLRPVITASSVELVNDVPIDLHVFADAEILKRIFENLLAFSIDSAPRGIVRIDAHHAGVDGVYCQVHHNGAVLSAKDAVQLFESCDPEESSDDGIGLGLAIVRQLVEAHGGDVSAVSNEKTGTTIKFRIPIDERSN
jgi:two-component system, OmpR family, phosphate regulon sensor histidine kinase PhoR